MESLERELLERVSGLVESWRTKANELLVDGDTFKKAFVIGIRTSLRRTSDELEEELKKWKSISS